MFKGPGSVLRYCRFYKADIYIYIYVITTLRCITIRLQQLERFPLRLKVQLDAQRIGQYYGQHGEKWIPSRDKDPFARSRKKWPSQAPFVIQCTRVLCRPGCLSANVVMGAGVFLFAIRGHSLIYEL